MVARGRPSAQAEQRLSRADAHFSRHLTNAGLRAALLLVVSYGMGVLGATWLARAGMVVVIMLFGRFIHLIVQRQRTLMAILIDDGMSKGDARLELLWRFGRG